MNCGDLNLKPASTTIPRPPIVLHQGSLRAVDMSNMIAIPEPRMFTLMVGPHNLSLNVPEDILVKTPYFNGAIRSGRFIEEETKVFHLPDDNARIVADILYRTEDNPFSTQGLLDWIRVYITADRLCVEPLATDLFNNIITATDRDHIYSDAFKILLDAGYENTDLFDTLVSIAAFHATSTLGCTIFDDLAVTLKGVQRSRTLFHLATAMADAKFSRRKFVSSTGALRIQTSKLNLKHVCGVSCRVHRSPAVPQFLYHHPRVGYLLRRYSHVPGLRMIAQNMFPHLMQFWPQE